MRMKELRIALVCYGGISLAVYMHGVTKEVWKAARASRIFHAGDSSATGSEALYLELLQHLAEPQGLRIRVLPDILTGASAGGINAVFLAQAIHSGQSLEPLTELWLNNADVDRLLDPEAQPGRWAAKFWAPPVVEYLLARPGNVVAESVGSETRRQVQHKLARFVRSRWFQPPFSGIGFSGLIADALDAMAKAPCGEPLLPAGHPIDLFVTATDFFGHSQTLRLNSPPIVEEREHRLSIGFRSRVPQIAGEPLAHPLELVLAARSTASFPGAFPPLKLAEIDLLAETRGLAWPTRESFLERIMPEHVRNQDIDGVSLIDGSVLVNAPFSEAMEALKGRPAQREVDRRFVYIDPTPERSAQRASEGEQVGFFRAIFGSISAIPREQPIRDNLELIQAMSREAEQLGGITEALRPEIERAVERIFGRTFLLDRPTPKRLAAWRARAQQAAAQEAGYAYHSYAQAKFVGIVARIARMAFVHVRGSSVPDAASVADRLLVELRVRGLADLGDPRGGASQDAITFFRANDIGFRIRRLRLVARRISRDWESDPSITDEDRDVGRDAVFRALAIYFERESSSLAVAGFSDLARHVMDRPGEVLDSFAHAMDLPGLDTEAEQILVEALVPMASALRRKILLAYLGFPFYDVATLPLLRNEGLTEFDPVKVDRISPEDAVSIREGGAAATLRGIEFYNFGAFFSRSYRENDYLWGRLHGADRMVDLICSTAPQSIGPAVRRDFKRQIFEAILDEEEGRLQADKALIPQLRREIAKKVA